MKIGLIGLGIMGKPMAKNLLKAGYTDLMVNDRNISNVDEVVAAGARYASQQEIGEMCNVVLTMLPNSPQVKEVMLAQGGVAEYMKPGSVFIDMSSINPVASKGVGGKRHRDARRPRFRWGAQGGGRYAQLYGWWEKGCFRKIQGYSFRYGIQRSALWRSGRWQYNKTGKSDYCGL